MEDVFVATDDQRIYDAVEAFGGKAIMTRSDHQSGTDRICEALDKGDYTTVGEKMYETHHGMSKLYEVSCEELDFLNDLAREFGVTGSRVMGGGFGGCTINLLKEELHDSFIAEVKKRYEAKYGIQPKFYDVVISDGARRL